MTFEGKEFFKASIDLDDNQFYDCIFDSCVLVYHGGVPPNIAKCSFKNSSFGFAGAAANTLSLIITMYHGGFKGEIEMAFKDMAADVSIDKEKIIFN